MTSTKLLKRVMIDSGGITRVFTRSAKKRTLNTTRTKHTMAQSSDTLQDFVIKAKNLQKKNKAKAKDPKPKNSQRPLLFVLGVPQG